MAGAQAKRCDDFVAQGNAFVADGHKQSDGIRALLDELTAAWGTLMQAITDRTTLLENATEIHTYYQDCEVTLNRIAEKSTENCHCTKTALRCVERKVQSTL